MVNEEQNRDRRTPGLVTWVGWVGLTALGGLGGSFLLSVVSDANASLNGLLIWCYLASPLFFVAVGQWVLLRRFVTGAGRWLLTSVLGFLFVYPYLLIYGFSALRTNGRSLIFGTQEFWSVSLSLALLALLIGGLVGLTQGILVIRRWGAVPGQQLWWVMGSAIAWRVGYPLGEQFLTSLLWRGSTPSSPLAIWLTVGTTWGIIGAITGVALLWVGRARVRSW
jgi:hypothetical protein